MDFLIPVPRTPTDACSPQHYHNTQYCILPLCRRIMMSSGIPVQGLLWRGVVFQNINQSRHLFPLSVRSLLNCTLAMPRFGSFDSQTCLTKLRVSTFRHCFTPFHDHSLTSKLSSFSDALNTHPEDNLLLELTRHSFSPGRLMRPPIAMLVQSSNIHRRHRKPAVLPAHAILLWGSVLGVFQSSAHTAHDAAIRDSSCAIFSP